MEEIYISQDNSSKIRQVQDYWEEDLGSQRHWRYLNGKMIKSLYIRVVFSPYSVQFNL